MHPDGTKFVHPMPVAYEEKVSTLLKELQEEVRIHFKILICMKQNLVILICLLVIPVMSRRGLGGEQRGRADLPLS